MDPTELVSEKHSGLGSDALLLLLELTCWMKVSPHHHGEKISELGMLAIISSISFSTHYCT
jgi:hypothetical protein